MRRILTEAGWSAIAIEELDADAYMGADLDEAVANFLAMGPIASLVQAAPDDKRAAIAAELRYGAARVRHRGRRDHARGNVDGDGGGVTGDRSRARRPGPYPRPVFYGSGVRLCSRMARS